MEHAKSKTPPTALAPILIALGVLLLIANTGLLSWNHLFNSFPLWPFVLVAIGILFLVGKRARVLGVLAVLGIGAGIYLFGPNSSEVLYETASNELSLGADRQILSVPLENASSVKVTLSPSIADLSLTALQDNSLFITGETETRNNETLESVFELRDDGEASYKLESKERGRWFGTNITAGKNWDLQMNTAVLVDLRVDLGVGESFLDLTGFQLKKLSVDTGVGGTEIILPQSGSFDVKIDSGVGTTLLRIPESLAVKLDIDRGLTGLNLQGDFLTKGDSYQSPNYEGSQQRVNIKIDSGVGEIKLIRF